MKRYLGFITLLATALCLTARADSAKVSVSVNQVSHGAGAIASAQPAPVGTLVQNGEFVKTGTLSRAELEFGNSNITRLGANTIFNYDSTNYTGKLKTGVVLFAKPKDGKTYEIKTASITAAIVGSIALVSFDAKTDTSTVLNEGGTISVIINGTTYSLKPGQGVTYTPGKPPYFFSFDLKKQTSSSGLLVDFPPLPLYNLGELGQGGGTFSTTGQFPDNAVINLNKLENPAPPPPTPPSIPTFNSINNG